VTAAERWLAAVWPVVRGRLPAPPAQIVEIGCGSLGGFVPILRSSGYKALGIDPEAPPDEEHYRRVEFERAELVQDLDAVVASTSLHHVADPAEVLDRITTTLAGGGTLVVVEWAWEDFDEATADWCFPRLGPDETRGWLHPLRLLDERFERVHLARGPYFFPDLAEVTESVLALCNRSSSANACT
jgi:SAM-dependent methyltransferase